MATEQVVDDPRFGGKSKISIATTRERLKTNCALFVDKKFVSLGVAATNESSTAIATSSFSSSCQQKTTAYDQHSCIYKPSEMARKIVCLRYLLTASFIILGISGAVICGTGSYYVHQLHSSITNPKFYGPPGILLTTGMVNIILGSYFWFFLDTKYNPPQLFMFLILVILVAIIQASAGIWSIVVHATIDKSISQILESNLASIGTIDDKPTWNITDIKVNCCGFENSPTLEDEDGEVDNSNKISWSCCNTERYNENNQYDDKSSKTCDIFYLNECHQLALHRDRSVLFYTFVLALCATILQIFQAICLSVYTKKWMKKRQRQSVIASVVNRANSNSMTCPVVQFGPQHVCEGCSSAPRYH